MVVEWQSGVSRPNLSCGAITVGICITIRPGMSAAAILLLVAINRVIDGLAQTLYGLSLQSEVASRKLAAGHINQVADFL